jgi:hypothetical protein
VGVLAESGTDAFGQFDVPGSGEPKAGGIPGAGSPGAHAHGAVGHLQPLEPDSRLGLDEHVAFVAADQVDLLLQRQLAEHVLNAPLNGGIVLRRCAGYQREADWDQKKQGGKRMWKCRNHGEWVLLL